MLFQIDKSIEGLNTLAAPYLVDLVEDLFTARAKGRHIIFAEPSTLAMLAALPGLSLRTQRTIDQVSKRVKQKKPLLAALDVYVRIVAVPGVLRTVSVGRQSIIEISAGSLRYDDFFREPLLIVENESDAEFFRHITEVMQRAASSAQQLTIDFTVIPGGGSQTPRTFNRLKASKRNFVLCVVDGDIEYFGGALGTNVAGPIYASNLTHPSPLTCTVILDCYSIENLIPPDLIHNAQAYKTGSEMRQPWVVELDYISRLPSWGFIPLKVGHKCSLLRSPCEKGTYWKLQAPSFPKPAKHCKNWGAWHACRNDCSVLPSISKSTLKDVVEYIMEDKSNTLALDAVATNLPLPIEKLWKEIASKVVAFGCSGDRLAPI